jgi:hypothetical protein
MGYRPFKIKKSEAGPATLATVATIRDEMPETVATVATVARANLKNHHFQEAPATDAVTQNREAAKAGLTDRWCPCGTMATVAVGRFRESCDNPEGVARWVYAECFEIRQPNESGL